MYCVLDPSGHLWQALSAPPSEKAPTSHGTANCGGGRTHTHTQQRAVGVSGRCSNGQLWQRWHVLLLPLAVSLCPLRPRHIPCTSAGLTHLVCGAFALPARQRHAVVHLRGGGVLRAEALAALDAGLVVKAARKVADGAGRGRAVLPPIPRERGALLNRDDDLNRAGRWVLVGRRRVGRAGLRAGTPIAGKEEKRSMAAVSQASETGAQNRCPFPSASNHTAQQLTHTGCVTCTAHLAGVMLLTIHALRQAVGAVVAFDSDEALQVAVDDRAPARRHVALVGRHAQAVAGARVGQQVDAARGAARQVPASLWREGAATTREVCLRQCMCGHQQVRMQATSAWTAATTNSRSSMHPP